MAEDISVHSATAASAVKVRSFDTSTIADAISQTQQLRCEFAGRESLYAKPVYSTLTLC